MEICVQHDKRILEVWLTRSEHSDTKLMTKLKPLCADYKKAGFCVAYFLSGDKDLLEETSALLCFNQRRAAEAGMIRRQDHPRFTGNAPDG